MKLPLDGPYDVVVGIGQTCANAAYMSRWNLRGCTGVSAKAAARCSSIGRDTRRFRTPTWSNPLRGFASSHVDLLVIEHRESAEGISEVWCAAPGTVRVRGRFVDTGGSLAMGNLKLNAEVYSSIPRAFCLRRMAWRRTLVRAWIHLYVQTYPKRVRRAKREELINRWLGKELF